MAVYGIAGQLYIGSITGASGSSGTLIGNVEARTIDLNVPRRADFFRTGVGQDQVTSFHAGTGLVTIALRGRDVAADTINLLWSDLATSGGLQGSGVASDGAESTKQAIIIRPLDNTERYLYIPNAAIVTQETRLLYSPSQSPFDEQEVLLAPTRASDSTEPAWAYDTAANINTLYAGLS
jgi:hypothetical protein